MWQHVTHIGVCLAAGFLGFLVAVFVKKWISHVAGGHRWLQEVAKCALYIAVGYCTVEPGLCTVPERVTRPAET
jgi:hypothetical protein